MATIQTIMTEKVAEQGTLARTVTFKDESGATVVPTSASWRLTDPYGNVANSRSAVAIDPLTSTVDLVLTGDDLALGGALRSAIRHWLIQWVYDSDLGDGLAGAHEIVFEILDFQGAS